MITMDVNVKYFLEWKKAYKECKKQASIMIKDEYDKFLNGVKNSYKDNFKISTDVEVNAAITFFKEVIEKSKEYLAEEEKWSSLYKDKRKKAVESLCKISGKMVEDLELKRSLIKQGAAKIDEIFDGKAEVKVKPPIDCIPFVLDIPYASNFAILNYFTIRCYILVRGKGALRFINDKFDFKNYVLSNSNKTVKNDNISKRRIYKVDAVPVDVLGGLGSVNVEVYISPNHVWDKIAMSLFAKFPSVLIEF